MHVFHAIAVLVLEAIFLVLVQSDAGLQRQLNGLKLKIPFDFRLNALGVVIAIVVAFDDGIVRAIAAFQVVKLCGKGCGVPQDIADIGAVNGLQFEPVAREVIAINGHFAAPASSGVNDVAHLQLAVFAVEQVTG